MQMATTKLYMTTYSTNLFWCECFAKGLHRRQGDLVKPDMALSLEQMVAPMCMLTLEWYMSPVGLESWNEVLFSVLFILSAYLGVSGRGSTPHGLSWNDQVFW